MSYIYSYLNTQKYFMDYILSAHYHIGRQLEFQFKLRQCFSNELCARMAAITY